VTTGGQRRVGGAHFRQSHAQRGRHPGPGRINTALAPPATNQVKFTTAPTGTTVTNGNILAFATVARPASAFDFASVSAAT